MTSSRWHRASHRAFRTEERRDSWSGEPSGTSISSPQKARLECGFQQGGGAVSFVTRERHSLLPRHPFLEFLPPRLPCLALPCLACLALFLLVPPPDRCPHHFRVLFLFLPLSLALFLSLFLSSPSTAFFGRPSRHAAFEFSPSRCHCTTLAVLPSQRLYTPSNGHSRKSAQRHSYAPVLQRPS